MTHNLSGAEYLASIYGTEKDKVNCSFYFKIGACRHGTKCSRTHNVPTFSQTILLKNLYHNPVIDTRQADAFEKVGIKNTEEHQFFEDFYEEIFAELADKYGQIEELEVCDNIGEHMIGNVYVKFNREEDAEKAVNGLVDSQYTRNYHQSRISEKLVVGSMNLVDVARRRLYGSRARSPNRFGPRGGGGGGGGGGGRFGGGGGRGDRGGGGGGFHDRDGGGGGGYGFGGGGGGGRGGRGGGYGGGRDRGGGGGYGDRGDFGGRRRRSRSPPLR